LDAKKRFGEEQIIGFLKGGRSGRTGRGTVRKHGCSDASFYLWRNKFGGMGAPDAKRLKSLEVENARLKNLPGESMLETEVTRDALRRSTDHAGSAGVGAVDDGEGLIGAP